MLGIGGEIHPIVVGLRDGVSQLHTCSRLPFSARGFLLWLPAGLVWRMSGHLVPAYGERLRRSPREQDPNPQIPQIRLRAANLRNPRNLRIGPSLKN